MSQQLSSLLNQVQPHYNRFSQSKAFIPALGLAGLLLLRSALARNARRKAKKAWSDWSKEVVIVTGGSSGIGADLVRRLIQSGAKVAILDILEPKSITLNQRVKFYKTDLTNHEDILKAKEQINKDLGKVTVLVNNAGVPNAGEHFIANDPKRVELTLKVNLIAHFHTCQAFLPDMLRANHGHIVTVASMASFATCPTATDYCASKVGALALHEGLRNDLDLIYNKPGVLTTVVHPYWVTTPMTDKLFKPELYKDFLTAEQVSAAITDALFSGQSQAIYLPHRMRSAAMLRAFPHSVQNWIRRRAGRQIISMSRTMKPMPEI